MKSRTFTLFIFSSFILAVTILTATIWDSIGLGEDKVLLAASTTVAFGISVGGIVVGLGEIKKQKTAKLWIGFIGHLVIIGFFILTIVYALSLR